MLSMLTLKYDDPYASILVFMIHSIARDNIKITVKINPQLY